MRSFTALLLSVLPATAAAQEGRFFVDQLGLRAGQHLDLDTGGLFHSPVSQSGVRCELTADGERLVIPADWEEDPLAGELLGGTWRRGTTDQGRAAWVQAPPEFERVDLDRVYPVRFIVRAEGDAALRRAPAELSILGLGDTVLLEWHAAPTYARYLVERRTPDGSFEPLAVLAGTRWVDAELPERDHFAYRVTGLTEQGEAGLPARAQTPREYTGPFTGTAVFGNQGAWAYDLVQERVEPDRGHLRLTGTYGGSSGASLSDRYGVPILKENGSNQLEPGDRFVMPLAAGGEARCELVSIGNDRRVVVDYSVRLDDATEERPNLLSLVAKGDGIHLRLALPEGSEPLRFTRVDHVAGRQVELELRGGSIDPNPPARTLLEYRVLFTFGHDLPPASVGAFLDRRPRGLVRGSLELGEREGWSFVRGAPCAEEDVTDLFITSLDERRGGVCAAPEGGSDLGDLRYEVRGIEDQLAAVVGVSAPKLTPALTFWKAEEAVLVLCVRHGGWVRLHCRGIEDGRVRLDYVYNPRGKLFVEELPEDDLDVHGFVIDLEPLDLETRSRMERRHRRR